MTDDDAQQPERLPDDQIHSDERADAERGTGTAGVAGAAAGAAGAEGEAGAEGAAGAEGVDDDRPPRRLSNGRLAALIAVVVLAIGAIVGAVLASGDDTPQVTIPATTASSTTTTVAWPATQARIATAKNPSILVHSTPPAGWDSMEPAQEWDNPVPVQSQSTMPPRPALPRPDYPIQGRQSDSIGWSFTNPSGWGDPFVMLVTERRGDWLKVEIPVRPNGTPGYVAAADVELSSTDYHLDLRLGTRTLTLYKGDQVVLTTPVVVGKPETRTPQGRFYITDLVHQDNPAGAYGPLALPTNAYSEQIDEFDNGVPVIALHGTNRPELVGQDVSNGCVRLPNDKIQQIADAIPMGTPIDISA